MSPASAPRRGRADDCPEREPAGRRQRGRGHDRRLARDEREDGIQRRDREDDEVRPVGRRDELDERVEHHAPGRPSSVALATIAASAAICSTPAVPDGSLSSKRTKPAAMGTAFVVKRRDPRGRERATALERALEKARPERVAGDERHQDDEPASAVAEELRRDVPAGEEQPGREPEPGITRAQWEGKRRRRGAARTGAEPEHDAEPVRSPVGLMLPGEREREQEQARERDHDARPLPPREAAHAPADADEREHRDPRRADRLHERERREPQRGDVDQPAGSLDREREHPRPYPQQEPERAAWCAQRERR